MKDVFFSYARTERSRVLPLKDALEKLGLSVFFDMEDIDGGDSFPDVIDRAVKSARAVVSAWSPHSLTRDWVKNECRVGQKRGVLIPVAIAPITYEEIPVDFSSLHYLDLIDFKSPSTDPDHDGYQALVSQLERILQRDLKGGPQKDTPSPSSVGIQPGEDKNYVVNLTFHEAALGVVKSLKLGTRIARVKIEAGSSHDDKLRLRGYGGSDGNGPGDAILRMNVAPSDLFSRQGNNLVVELPVSLLEALDGATVNAPTLQGFVEVKVPSGANTGDVVKVAQKGINGGDLLCRVRITLPDRDNQDLRQVLLGWAGANEKPLRPSPTG